MPAMIIRRRSLVAAAAATCLLLSACRSGGNNEALAKGDFVAAAERICRRLDRDGSAIARRYFGEDFSGEPSVDEQAEFFRRLIPTVEAGLTQMRALEGPVEAEALVDRIIDGDPFIPAAKQALERYDAGDRIGFERAVEDLFNGQSDSPAAMNAEATAYGLDECVDDGGGDHEEAE